MAVLKRILKKLYVIQEVSNKGRSKKYGRGFFTARRLNPYNPLSYITIIVVFVLALICFGIIGMWKEIDIKNPFKWD
jgi:hypothetical protein